MAANKRGGYGQCKICFHPGKAEIDAMLLNGEATYTVIVSKMKAAWPGAPVISAPNISKHKKNHLLTRPIKTTEVDPATGQQTEAYLIGHITEAITVPRQAIPTQEQVVSIPEALGTIINAGIRNILTDPSVVTPQMVLLALDMSRKLGIGGKEVEEFQEAWRALEKAKAKVKGKRTTTVTVEETVERDGDTVDGTVAPAAGWEEADLKLLGGPDNGATD